VDKWKTPRGHVGTRRRNWGERRPRLRGIVSQGPRAGRRGSPTRLGARLEQYFEDLAREGRAPGDESREVTHRRGPGAQKGSRLVGCIDTTGGDDLQGLAEARPGPLDVGERGGKQLRTGETAHALGQSRVIHPASIAVVDDADAGVQRRG